MNIPITGANSQLDNIKRASNIECLRCIAMLFIILYHCILNIATKRLSLDVEPINFCLTDFAYQVVYNGVNVFVLISGYFLVKTTRNTTNWEKVTKLWLSVFFYSILIYTCSMGLHWESFNLQELIHILMPIRYDSYWFITQYLGLYIMSPFLAKWARSMSKQEYKTMLVSFFIITSIIQLQGLKGGFSLIWFLFIFMFAGYIQLWENESIAIKKWNTYAGIFFIFISVLLFLISFSINGKTLNIVGYLGFYNGPLLFIASVSLFLFFRKMKESKLVVAISKLSPYMFGVYLVHENPIVKKHLWDYLNGQLTDVWISNLLFIAIIILFLSTFIEYLKLLIFKTLKIDTRFYNATRNIFLPIAAKLKNLIHKCLIH